MNDNDNNELYEGGMQMRTGSGRNAISFGSQLLAVAAGFCVFIVLLALFAAVQHRKRRRSFGSSRSPLIHKYSFGSAGAAGGTRQPSQAIPPPPQYLRCSNQSLRKCSSPAGSDYSLSSYSSSAGSGHSLSPMSPYGHHHQMASAGGGLYQQSPFAGVNFIPYGPPNSMGALQQQQHRKTSAVAADPAAMGDLALMGGHGNVPELVVDADKGRGTVSLQLAYDANNLALQITVLACNGLPSFAGNCTPVNPYIKIRLLPEGQHRVKTRILRDTRDPVFDEAFNMYGLSGDTVRHCRLHLAALAFDRYNGDTVLGEAVYDLADFHAAGGMAQAQNVSLKWEARVPFGGQLSRGKALVGLHFDAQSRKVRFGLRRMSELPRDASLGSLDPYAKMYALANGQRRLAKRKSKVLRRTQSPEFGPEDWLEFTIPEGLGLDRDGVPRALSFHVVLFNHDGVKRNEPIGQFTVDAESEQFLAAFHGKGGADVWHNILPL